MLRLLRTRVLSYCSGIPRSRLVSSSSTTPRGSSSSWSFLKFGLFTPIAGAIAGTTYVTCAYSLDEVDWMTRAMRTISSYLVEDNKSGLQKFKTLVHSSISATYSLDEVDWMTRAMRTISSYLVEDNKSGLQKFKTLVHSSISAIPAKSVELYIDTRRAVEAEVRSFSQPLPEKLLEDLPPGFNHFVLVLDLDETLAYSECKFNRGWRTFTRPRVEAFLEYVAHFYEIIVYSDRQNLYSDPALERLLCHKSINRGLSRSANRYVNGKYYRDLSILNRDPARIIYVSAHALESCLQRENCVSIKPWKWGRFDNQLFDLVPFLQYLHENKPADVRPVLASYKGCDIPTEFARRKEEHERFVEANEKQLGWRRIFRSELPPKSHLFL